VKDAVKHTPLAAALLAALSGQGARANDLPMPTVAQVEIVGVAPLAGLGIERDVLPYSVQGASARRLREAQSGSLTEYMARHLDGVNVNDISGSPFQTDVTYRGFRASPVLGAAQGLSVWLDGVRVNEPFGDVVNWDMLPEAALANVLLVPGANPLYGLNSLGGALALTTKSGRSHPGTELEASVASNGQRRVDVTHGVRLADGWHVLTAGTAFHDGGWRAHSEGRLGNAFFKLGRADGADEWSLSLLGARARLGGNGLLPERLYALDRRAAYTFPDQTSNGLAQATLNVHHQLADAQELTLTSYARNSRRDTVNGDVGDDTQATFNTTRTRQQSHGATLQWSATPAAHNASAGVSIDRNHVSFAQFGQAGHFSAGREVLADDDAPITPAASVVGSARGAALFASDTWTIVPGTSITAALRLNHASIANTLTNAGGAQDPERFSYRHWNPSLGASQQWGQWTVFANAAQNNRVPTVIELGCANPQQPCRLPVGLQSDPYLAQVVSTSLEAGVRWHPGAAALSLSAYRTANRDDILFLNAANTQQGYFANFTRTVHQGIDFNASHKIGALEAQLSYNYLDARYDADGVLFMGAREVAVRPGMRIAGLPRHTVKLGLQWKPSAQLAVGLDASLQSSMVSQGNEDGAIAGANIGGHALLHLRASYQLGRQWELIARIGNVTDRRYQSFGAIAIDHFPVGRFAADGAPARFVAPGAPRALTLGVRATF
jgi:outer membrane cobalamin receptor